MEKVNRIVVSKKEEKKLNELLHLLDLLGIDSTALIELIGENKELRKQIRDLKNDIEMFKQEARSFIQSQLNEIAVNVHNEAVKNTKNMQDSMKSFFNKGSHINEQY